MYMYFFSVKKKPARKYSARFGRDPTQRDKKLKQKLSIITQAIRREQRLQRLQEQAIRREQERAIRHLERILSQHPLMNEID